MLLFTQIASAIQTYAWSILWAGAVLTAAEFLFPQSRCSLVSRLRAIVFWGVYIAITAAATTLFVRLWSSLGWRPWLTLPLGAWLHPEQYPVLRAMGWVAAPILVGIISDFFYYWFHRIQHAIPLLWRFHSVHHSLREMSAFNSNHHFTEEIFRIPVVVIPLSLIVVPDAGYVPIIVATVLGMQGLYEHSATKLHLGPLRYVIADNRFHRIHHSLEPQHWHKNFGSFSTVWDVIFRTARMPRRNEWPQVGLADTPEPSSLSDFLWRPFRRQSRPLQ